MLTITHSLLGLLRAAASRPCALVVEDNAQVSEILPVFLEDDYDVICVARPEEALTTLLSDGRIDVVLLDYFLVGGNGERIASLPSRWGCRWFG
jgi:DNA-binding response OmpR family regulator